MAVPYDQISSITQKYIVPKMVDNIFQSYSLLDRMKKKGLVKVRGGASIKQPVLYAKSSSDIWFSGAEVLNSSDIEQFTAAEFDWKQAQVPITVRQIDEIKNSGKEAILNFVKEKIQAAELTMSDQLSSALYNDGSASDQVVGLRAVVDTDNTYGTIARSGNSWWQSQEDTSTTVFSIASLQVQYGAASIGNDKPSVITTTQAVYNRFHSELQPQERFMDKDTAEAGFVSLMYNGSPFLVDDSCPANHLFLLNEEYLYLAVHPDHNFRFRAFMEENQQASKTARIFFAGALVCSNPRLQGAFKSMSS